MLRGHSVQGEELDLLLRDPVLSGELLGLLCEPQSVALPNRVGHGETDKALSVI